MSLFFHSLDKKTRKCQMSKVKIAAIRNKTAEERDFDI